MKRLRLHNIAITVDQPFITYQLPHDTVKIEARPVNSSTLDYTRFALEFARILEGSK
jgi:hypothetical protein